MHTERATSQVDVARYSETGFESFRPVEAASTETTESGQLIDFTFYKTARAFFREIGATLKYLTDIEIDDHEVATDKPLHDEMKSPLPVKYLLETDNIHAACRIAKQHGMKIVIIGALTSGTEAFGPKGVKYDSTKIIAIRPKSSNFKPIVSTSLDTESRAKIETVKSNEVRILRDDSGKPTGVRVGAGVIPDDLNTILAQEGLYVPVDLTTKNQVMLGSVLATGAMGPSRVRPHQIIRKAIISNGETLTVLEGVDIAKIEGLLGINGAIVEMELDVYEVPKEQFGLMVPLNVTEDDPTLTDWPEKLAALLSHLEAATNLKLEDGKMRSDWEQGYINGIEIFTRSELEFVLAKSSNAEAKNLAQTLLERLAEAGSKFLVSITGRSQKKIFDLEDSPTNPFNKLFELFGDGEIGEPMETSNRLSTVYTLREEIPALSKTEGNTPGSPDEIVFSTSTDINTTINPDFILTMKTLTPDARIAKLQELYHLMFQPYLNYEEGLQFLASELANKGVKIIVRRYGHALPVNIDLHTRATAIGHKENTADFDYAVKQIKALKDKLTKALLGLRSNPAIQVSHGEKGKPPSLDLLTKKEVTEITDDLKTDENNTLESLGWRLKGTKLGQLVGVN